MSRYKKKSTGRKNLTEREKWQEYEARKQELFYDSCSCEDYRDKLHKLVTELGI